MTFVANIGSPPMAPIPLHSLWKNAYLSNICVCWITKDKQEARQGQAESSGDGKKKKIAQPDLCDLIQVPSL